jgi:hypothetical protein
VLRDHNVHKDTQVLKELLVTQVLRDHKVHKDTQELKVLKVIQVLKEILELKEMLVHKVM